MRKQRTPRGPAIPAHNSGKRVQAEPNAPLPRTRVSANDSCGLGVCEERVFDPAACAAKVASEAQARQQAKQEQVGGAVG